MEYRIVTTTEEFVSLKETWIALETMSSKIPIFSTFDYCFSYWKTVESTKTHKLWIICVLHNQKVVGIAPLVIERQTIYLKQKIDILRFLAPGDYQEILINNRENLKTDNILKTVFEAIEENSQHWDRIHLTHISQLSPLTHFLFKSKYNKDFVPLIENPFIDLSKCANFSEFEKKHTPDKAKQYAKRLKNKINYRFSHNEVNLEDCIEIHKKEQENYRKRGLKHRYSIFDNPQTVRFVNSLYALGKIHIFTLQAIETRQIIIYNWGYLKDGTFYSVNTGYDPEFEDLAVGRVMYYELIQHAYKTNLFTILDAGTGRYSWKFEWTSYFNLVYQLVINRPRSPLLKMVARIKDLAKMLCKG